MERGNSHAFLEALAGKLIVFSESAVRPRVIQRGLDRSPGERVGRGVILVETTAKPPVAQRAGGIYVYRLRRPHVRLTLSPHALFQHMS